MNIGISPYSPINSFCKEPNGLYIASCVLDRSTYNPMSSIEEDDIPTAIEKLKELLQFFKGEHKITVSKLIHVAPYEYTPMYRQGREPEIRDWKIENVKELTVELTVVEPKAAKVIAENGKGGYGEKGWFLRAIFNIDGIRNREYGCVCSSLKDAKEHAEWTHKHNDETSHWIFEDTRKPRRIKCNDCGKQILNTEAQQCSSCGKYYCVDCLPEDTCSNCGTED